MNFKKNILFFLLILGSSLTNAQNYTLEKDFYFRYDFFNREFHASRDKIVNSSTIHSVLLNPSIGLKFGQSDKANHRIMMGIDIFKNMGENPVTNTLFAPEEGDKGLENSNYFKEISLYYQTDVRTVDGHFSAYAGVLPRRFMQGIYSESIFSDANLLTDRNMEGMLFQYNTERFNAELGCDWMGKYGEDRRERFQIFSAGEYHALNWLSIGWDASMFHFANSRSARTVAYNNMLDGFLLFKLNEKTGLDEFSVKIGPKLSCQYTQKHDNADGSTFNFGAESVIKLRRRTLGLTNTLFYGQDMMSLYDKCYDLNSKKVENEDEIISAPYSGNLYTGSPFYHSLSGDSFLYDKVELFYQPHINDFIDLKISADFHFTSQEYKMAGSQQKVSLIIKLP